MRVKHHLFLLSVLLLACGPLHGARASTTVLRPDQHYTVGVYRYATVERVATAEITKFEHATNGVVFTSPAGIISGDKVGKATLDLVEYDIDADTIYKSKIHVTVVPMDKTVDWKLDPSANSQAVKNYVQQNGYLFPIGMQYSARLIWTRDGKFLSLSYSTNRPSVATVDQNGTVTMRGAGTAAITISPRESPSDSQTVYIVVYDENSGGSMNGSFDPEDAGQRLNVYKSADTDSKVVATIGTYDFFYIFSKNSSWTRVSIDGIVGYVHSSALKFYDGYNNPALAVGGSVASDAVDQAAVGEAGQSSGGTDTVIGSLYVQTGNTGKLHLRKGMSAKAVSRGRYPNGTPVSVLASYSGWYKVSVDGKTGYMMSGYLTAAMPDAGIRPAGDSSSQEGTAAVQGGQATIRHSKGSFVNLRKDRDPDAKVVQKLPDGTVVEVLSMSKYWCYVRCDGNVGYVLKEYLAF